MPETPIAVRLPSRCPHCDRIGTVRLQQTIDGERVKLEWRCSGCETEWPVRRKEEEIDTANEPSEH